VLEGQRRIAATRRCVGHVLHPGHMSAPSPEPGFRAVDADGDEAGTFADADQAPAALIRKTFGRDFFSV
jgi:hypothetical protein